MKTSKALVIIFDGVEEMEAVAPVDLLRRAGAEVTLSSASPEVGITGRNGIRLTADASLADCLGTDYDMVVLPGGPGHAKMVENAPLRALLQSQDNKGGWIASICAGPVVLKHAGLLEGRAFTSFPGTADQLPDRDPEHPVVRDGRLITSQGAGTATRFALALVEALFDAATREKIAASICH